MALNYKYMLLNMRDKSAALEALKATPEVWGIEVTDPALAGGCKTNIDPQHGNVNCGLYFGPLHHVGVEVNENGDPVSRMPLERFVLSDEGRQFTHSGETPREAAGRLRDEYQGQADVVTIAMLLSRDWHDPEIMSAIAKQWEQKPVPRTPAAIEYALHYYDYFYTQAPQFKAPYFNSETSTLATIRPDLDSVGAMAIFEILATECKQALEIPVAWADRAKTLTPAARQRIASIAKADTFAQGPWPGSRSLPTEGNPWPTDGAVEDTSELAAIASLIANPKRSLEQRVEFMRDWILAGESGFSGGEMMYPDLVGALSAHRQIVEHERSEMISALNRGDIKIRWGCDGIPPSICVVESTWRSATMLGYCMAPVVIAVNPRFSFNGGPEHLKYTVCQWQEGYVDLTHASYELCSLEPGWGGSKTIIGSPQGKASLLSIEQVLATVKEHLTPNREEVK